MRSRLLIAFSIMTTTVVSGGVIGPLPPQPSLADLPPVGVTVTTKGAGDVVPDPAYEEALRSRLSRAGIPLIPRGRLDHNDPILVLLVSPERLELELKQEVILVRNPAVRLMAPTWRAGARTNNDFATLDYLVTVFSEAYRRVNPPESSTE